MAGCVNHSVCKRPRTSPQQHPGKHRWAQRAGVPAKASHDSCASQTFGARWNSEVEHLCSTTAGNIKLAQGFSSMVDAPLGSTKPCRAARSVRDSAGRAAGGGRCGARHRSGRQPGHGTLPPRSVFSGKPHPADCGAPTSRCEGKDHSSDRHSNGFVRSGLRQVLLRHSQRQGRDGPHPRRDGRAPPQELRQTGTCRGRRRLR